MLLRPYFFEVLCVLCSLVAACDVYNAETLERCDEPPVSLIQTSMRVSRSLARQLQDVSDRIVSMVNLSESEAPVLKKLNSSIHEKHLKEIDPSVASLLLESETSSDTSASSRSEHKQKIKEQANVTAVDKLHAAKPNHRRGGNATRLHIVLSQVQDLLKGCKTASGGHQMPNEHHKCSNATMLSLYHILAKQLSHPEAHKSNAAPDKRSDLQIAQAIFNDTDHKIQARVIALASAIDEYKELLKMRQQMDKLSSEVAPQWWQEKLDQNRSGDELALLVQRLEQLQKGVLTNTSVQEDRQERTQQNLLQFKLLHGKHDDEHEYPLISASQATTPSSGFWTCQASNWEEGWECTKSVVGSLVAFVLVLGVLILASYCPAMKQPKSHGKFGSKFIYG